MSISKSLFNQQVSQFAKKSKEIGENWMILSETFSEINPDDVKPDDIIALTKYEVTSSNSPLNQIVTVEYSVIYSESYEVPVMYYRLSLQDGSIKTLDIEQMGGAVSQVEHPMYFQPFYMVHPCNTKELMTDRQCDYLICWLTSVGTLISLKFSNKLLDNNVV